MNLYLMYTIYISFFLFFCYKPFDFYKKNYSNLFGRLRFKKHRDNNIQNRNIQNFEVVFKGEKIILIAHFIDISHHLLMVIKVADLKKNDVFSFGGLYLIGDLEDNLHGKVEAEGTLNAQLSRRTLSLKIEGILKTKSNELYNISINANEILNVIKDAIIGTSNKPIHS